MFYCHIHGKEPKFPRENAFIKFGFRELKCFNFPKTLDETRKMDSMS